jgi:hypothetical protein
MRTANRRRASALGHFLDSFACIRKLSPLFLGKTAATTHRVPTMRMKRSRYTVLSGAAGWVQNESVAATRSTKAGSIPCQARTTP